MVVFYHYTSTAGKDAILSSKIIKQSDSSGDARFGNGVYGTSLSPETGKKLIAQNNWDDNRTKISKQMLRRAAWAIKISIPYGEIVQPDSSRDILLYPGDLDLRKYDYEVIKV